MTRATMSVPRYLATRLSITLWFAVAGAVVAAAEPRIQAVDGLPNAPSLKSSVAAVEHIYQQKIEAARTPAARVSLAQEIFANRSVASTPAERYGILVAALNVATKGNDPSLLFSIVDDLATEFEIDRISLFTERIDQTTGPIDTAKWPSCLHEMTAMVSECTATGRFDEATKLANAVSALGKRARDPKATALFASLKRTIAEAQKVHGQFEKLRGEASKADASPEALREFGRLLCFSRNNWREGAQYLVKARDPVLSGPASMELSAQTAEEKLAAADAWASAADKADPADRRPMRERAAVIYAELLPSLEGLGKVRAENALQQVLKSLNSSGKGPSQNQWIVVFRSADPGVWNTDTSGDATSFAIPLDQLPPIVRFVRLRRANGAAVIIPIDRASLGLETATKPFGWNGTNLPLHGARMLGIIDHRTNVDKKTGVVAISRKDGLFSGWGFGHRINHGGPAELCWNGQWIPKEPIEIAVIGRALTPEEERCVLQ